MFGFFRLSFLWHTGSIFVHSSLVVFSNLPSAAVNINFLKFILKNQRKVVLNKYANMGVFRGEIILVLSVNLFLGQK